MLKEQEDTWKRRLCMHNIHMNKLQWSTSAPNMVPFPGNWAEPTLQEEQGDFLPNTEYIVVEWYQEMVLLEAWTSSMSH